MRKDVQYVTTPGIYWNSTDGLISLSSDGSTRYTIADKNLGATTVYNDGDALSGANCGNIYQWGNNYGFNYGNQSGSMNRVNASNYGPGNYYSSSTYIKPSGSPYDRSSVQNDNLRGNTTNTLEARKGPCDEGFHVPTYNECMLLINMVSGGNDFKSKYKMPMAGYISATTLTSAGTYGMIWSSSVTSTNAYTLQFRSNNNKNMDAASRYWGAFIRPFKNIPVQPDNTWIVLYQSS